MQKNKSQIYYSKNIKRKTEKKDGIGNNKTFHFALIFMATLSLLLLHHIFLIFHHRERKRTRKMRKECNNKKSVYCHHLDQLSKLNRICRTIFIVSRPRLIYTHIYTHIKQAAKQMLEYEWPSTNFIAREMKMGKNREKQKKFIFSSRLFSFFIFFLLPHCSFRFALAE